MRVFEGCIQAKEISLTRKGANPHAHVLIRKNAEPKPGSADPKTEKLPMSTEAEKAAAATAAAIQKAAISVANKIASMSDVTKAHYLALDEDGQIAFLAKSAVDQAKEAEADKADKDKEALEAEAAKTGKTARELELEKRVATQGTEIEELKKAQVERDLEKRADTEFAGFPGGVKAVIPLLKAYAKLPDEERKASEELLKSQAKMAKEATKTFGARTEEETSKVSGAAARIEKKVVEVMAEKKMSRGDAYEHVTELQEFADDVAAIG